MAVLLAELPKVINYIVINLMQNTHLIKVIITYKNELRNLMFGDTEIEKNKLYCYKSPIFFKRCRY